MVPFVKWGMIVGYAKSIKDAKALNSSLMSLNNQRGAYPLTTHRKHLIQLKHNIMHAFIFRNQMKCWVFFNETWLLIRNRIIAQEYEELLGLSAFLLILKDKKKKTKKCIPYHIFPYFFGRHRIQHSRMLWKLHYEAVLQHLWWAQNVSIHNWLIVQDVYHKVIVQDVYHKHPFSCAAGNLLEGNVSPKGKQMVAIIVRLLALSHHRQSAKFTKFKDYFFKIG